MLRNLILALALVLLALPMAACTSGGCGGGMSLGGQGLAMSLPRFDLTGAQPSVPGPRMRVQTQTVLIPEQQYANTTRTAAPRVAAPQYDPCNP